MFSVSEYLSHIERAYLDILEGLKPVSKAITLWLGLDGLRLNEDGTMEWVSRKKKLPETVFYQPCQYIESAQARLQVTGFNDQTQSADRGADESMPSLANAIMAKYANGKCAPQYCVQYPAQYPPYYYGGCCLY